jgi:hypothetical protein
LIHFISKYIAKKTGNLLIKGKLFSGKFGLLINQTDFQNIINYIVESQALNTQLVVKTVIQYFFLFSTQFKKN